MAIHKAPQLAIADKLLLMPDLLGYLLCGDVSAEYTHASTTQMLNSQTGTWSEEIIGMMGIDGALLPPIRMSGERKGALYECIRQEAGLKSTPPVYSVGSHDTASTVASVPAEYDDFAFLSSGTWSLIGIIRNGR